MNFENSLHKLVGFLEKEPKSYALIGGFALGLYGVARATMDLDFLIDKRRAAELKDFMRRQKAEIIYESENVIQFQGPLVAVGSVDFLYAFRAPSIEMLKRCKRHKVFQEKIEINALVPEDLIGLKVQAMVNNPKRKLYDADDIRRLIEENKSSIDWKIVAKHFALFDQQELFKKLKDSYGGKEK